MADREEDLARIADRQAPGGPAPTGSLQARVADTGRAGAQVGEVGTARTHGDGGFVDVEGDAVAGTSQDAPHGGRTGRLDLRGYHRSGQLRAVLGVQSHASVTPRLSRIIRASHYLKPVRLA